MVLLRSFVVLALSMGLVAVTSAAPAPTVKTDPHESLDTLIAEGIRLLEAKEYVKTIEFLATPEDVAMMKKMEGGVEQVAKVFGETKADLALQVLKQIKTQKPTMNAEETLATYKIKDAKEIPEMKFERIGKQWFLRN